MDHQRTHSRGARAKGTRASSGQTWLANGRRRFPVLFSRIGPVTLSICSVLLMSLMAILYLYQQGQTVTTNQQIQALRNQQTTLQRQNDDLVNTIATEQSPEYIAAFAEKMGLEAANPQDVRVISNP